MDEIIFTGSPRFRTVGKVEKSLGLWVERVNSASYDYDSTSFRDLRTTPHYAAVHILSGTGIYHSEKWGKLKVSPGDTLILFPKLPHCYYSTSGKWMTRWFAWAGKEAGLLEDIGILSRQFPVIGNSSHAYEQVHSLIRRTVLKENMLSILERKAALWKFITELYKLRTPENQVKDDVAEKIERAIQMMKENCNSRITVAEIAENVCLSETYFRKLFKAYTGHTPKEFLVSQKINKAKELLHSGMSIKGTAAELGFRDVFYFMRVFKKVTGETAGKYF